MPKHKKNHFYGWLRSMIRNMILKIEDLAGDVRAYQITSVGGALKNILCVNLKNSLLLVGKSASVRLTGIAL